MANAIKNPKNKLVTKSAFKIFLSISTNAKPKSDDAIIRQSPKKIMACVF